MSNPVRNLPSITTLQHNSISSHPQETTIKQQQQKSNSPSLQEIKEENGQESQQLQHASSEGIDDQDRNPVHPNAKTTSTTNAANGSTTTKTNISSPVCRNCKTQTTPLWRRDESGQVLCNACGLFLKLHGRPRPISLKTDVIKSRNRVRHTPNGPNKGNQSNPNTPELKAREHNGQQKPKFSPKQYKPSKSNKNSPALSAMGGDGQSLLSPLLVPLLPRGDQNSANQYQYSNWSSHLHPQQQHRQTQQQSYVKQHQHFAQPLHYPSSVPTQYAPSLATITSPLLLLTTSSTPKFSPSQSSERGSLLLNKQNDKEMAAVALETLANDHDDKRISSVKLDDSNTRFNGKLYSPSTALNSTNSPIFGAQTGTKLPALVLALVNGQEQQDQHDDQQTGSLSPSFGPQFSLTHQHAPHHHSHLSNSSSIPTIRYDDNDTKSTPPLPPLKPLLNEASHNLPSLHAHHQPLLNSVYSTPATKPASQEHSPNQQLPPIQQHLALNTSEIDSTSMLQRPSSQSSVDNSNQQSSDDTHLLKTRISELELVNDLYRTRIMELELMENAARQRENLLKKRLEELKMLPNISNDSKLVTNEQGEPERKKLKLDN